MTVQEHIDTNIFTVNEEEESLRIDKLLANRFDAKSRSYFQYLIENDCVLLNGNPVKKRALVHIGDEIEVFFCLTPEISLEPEEIPLKILFEDEHLLAIDKPPGMVVHPAPGNWSGTFVNALLAHCKNLVFTEDAVRPGIVHRLDKGTSGILLAAKTRLAHQRLIQAFAARKVEKRYLAITQGKPLSGTLSAPIARHPKKRKEMSVQEGGKEAVSHISIIAYSEKLCLVLIQPETGRTHQIRVHLKHLKAPILGDEVYGNPNHSFSVFRPLLHAYRLKIDHPISKTPLDICAPIPDDMKKIITSNFKSPVV